MENCIHFWTECCQKYALFKKKLQIKVFRHRILEKKVREGICLSPTEVELDDSKNDMVPILNCTETENCFHFWAERCRTKVFHHRIWDKKVSEGICLSPPGEELGPQKMI